MKSLSARLVPFVLLVALAAHAAAADRVFPAGDWEVAKPESQAMSGETLAKIEQWHKDNGSKTGLIVRHGRIVGEWYFGDTKPDTKLLVYSTTKSFASTAAGLAIAQGKLKLDSKLGEFFPYATPEEKREITVRQLLSMISGTHSDNDVLKRDDLFTYALHDLPMDKKPGTGWVYNNSGLSLLSPIVHEATGKNIDDLLDEEIFQKIGIRREDWSWETRGDMPIPYSGLHITARSLARFGLLFLNNGNWNGQQLVSADWVAEATGTSQDLNKAYGYLWWNNTQGVWRDVPKDAYAAMGRFDNDMLVVPGLDLIVIRQVGDDTAANRTVRIAELFNLAASACEDRSAEE